MTTFSTYFKGRAESLDIGCKEKSRTKDKFWVWGLNNWINCSAFY